jgi:hypothetical protein
MSKNYWTQRKDEILAFREYALSFDLSKDLETGAWLSESGHQLMEIAFQLLFLGLPNDALALVQRAIHYYQAALVRESKRPESDPRMATTYHRLYYARWWITGQEPLGLLRQAASAFVTGLGQPPNSEDADIYVRAAHLWLELGEVNLAEKWLSLAEWAVIQTKSNNVPPNLSLMHQLLDRQRVRATSGEACTALQVAIENASTWEQPTASTLWDALQLANIHRRLCGPQLDLPGLLMQIR